MQLHTQINAKAIRACRYFLLGLDFSHSERKICDFCARKIKTSLLPRCLVFHPHIPHQSLPLQEKQPLGCGCHTCPPTSHTLHSGILSSNSASPTSIRTWGHIRQTRQLISRQLGPWILISSSVRFLALFPRLIKAGYSGRLRVRGVDVASLAQSWRAGEEDWGWSS